MLRGESILTLFIMLGSCFFVKAQENDIVLSDTSVLADENSLYIFQLLDSLMNMPEPEVHPLLAVRIGYNSNVLSAGQTLGIEQFGLSPGVSYYHPSGVYTDVTTYWSNDFDPPFYLTTASLGYMHSFTTRFSAIASFDHFFYNFGDGIYIPFSNAVTLSPYYELKPFSLRIDYSFYFGDAQAHRIMPGLTLNLEKRKFLGIDRVSCYPAAYVLIGNENFSKVEWIEPSTVKEAVQNLKKYGTRYRVDIHEKSTFGVMNYAFSLPLNFTLDTWTLNVTYTYSIPQVLHDESPTLPKSGYISASIIRYIGLIPHKKPL